MNGVIVAGRRNRTITWDPSFARVGKGSGLGARDPTEGRVIAGRYRVVSLLGRGGMGAVWLAQDSVLRRAVALKRVVDRGGDQGPNALREARAAARVAHPGVVTVHDVVPEDDGGWIVMEALPGQPLSTRIRERGRLRVGEVVSIGLQVLSALEAIHAAGLVHRDVKPSNIHVCDADRVVLTDLGLSSPARKVGGLRTGTVAGSPPFMAPESLLDGSYGRPSDLYGLGVTLYRAVEGRPPFEPAEPLTEETLRSRGLHPTRHAGGCLDAVLVGLLEQDPARRLDIEGAREQLLAAERLTSLAWAG